MFPKKEVPRFYLEKLEEKYWLIKANRIDTILKPILSILVNYNEEPDQFSSFTINPDEISVIVGNRQKEKFMNQNHNNLQTFDNVTADGPYLALGVDTADPGKDEAGILAEMTNTFAKYSISIICCSTYLRNFIFFPLAHQEQFEELIKAESDYLLE